MDPYLVYHRPSVRGRSAPGMWARARRSNRRRPRWRRDRAAGNAKSRVGSRWTGSWRRGGGRVTRLGSNVQRLRSTIYIFPAPPTLRACVVFGIRIWLRSFLDRKRTGPDAGHRLSSSSFPCPWCTPIFDVPASSSEAPLRNSRAYPTSPLLCPPWRRPPRTTFPRPSPHGAPSRKMQSRSTRTSHTGRPRRAA